VNDTLAHFIAPGISAVLTGLTVGTASYVAVRTSLVRIQTQMEERERQLRSRDADVDEKFERLHGALGMMGTNGGGYMRRGECAVRELDIANRLADIKAEVHEFHQEVNGRLAKIEARVDIIEREDK
jgi:hypothetical protein